MPGKTTSTLRAIVWPLHRWLGVGFCLLLVPIAVSGALLVFKDNLDALLHPSRYAVTGAEMSQPFATYLTNAGQAAGTKASPVAMHFPIGAGWPVTVQAREARTEGRPTVFTVYLDPPTARVLDVVEFRSSLFGFLHRFHENLTIPQHSGRAIIGWGGIAMLILALSGIWLWWPRNGAFLRGLRWSRSPATTTNLHHLLGFWISLPLAFVSLTGIYLSFPQIARTAMQSVLPMGPSQRGTFGGALASNARMTPEQALDAARVGRAGAQPVALFLPTGSGGAKGGRNRNTQGDGPQRDRAETPSIAWRIQLRMENETALANVLVDDASGTARTMPDLLAGDRAAQWIRWLHEGSNSGPLWRFVVLLTGVFPPIFAITGVMMWLRGRRQRRDRAALSPGALQAAE
jgi:uncharacterized iron-regulated membrane protein